MYFRRKYYTIGILKTERGLLMDREKVIVRTETVYVEKQVQNTVAVAGSSTEITPDGIIRPRGVILKWVFFILLAVIALLIIKK